MSVGKRTFALRYQMRLDLADRTFASSWDEPADKKVAGKAWALEPATFGKPVFNIEAPQSRSADRGY
jgi:hypothetical protein